MLWGFLVHSRVGRIGDDAIVLILGCILGAGFGKEVCGAGLRLALVYRTWT